MSWRTMIKKSLFVFLLASVPSYIYANRLLHNRYLVAGLILTLLIFIYSVLTAVIGGAVGIITLNATRKRWIDKKTTPLKLFFLFLLSVAFVSFTPMPFTPEQVHFYQNRERYNALVEMARQTPDQLLDFNGTNFKSLSWPDETLTIVFRPLNPYGKIVYTEDKANLELVWCYPYSGSGSGTGLSGRFWGELDRNWYLCYQSLDL